MRKTLKKGIGAVLLAGVLVASMGGTAFAGKEDNNGGGGGGGPKTGIGSSTNNTTFPGGGQSGGKENTCNTHPWAC